MAHANHASRVFPSVGKKEKRIFQVALDKIDKEARTVELSFSSETPVRRAEGMEVLAHNESSVILDRLNSGASVLWNHNPDVLLGRVVKAWVDTVERKGRAVVYFSADPESDRRFQQVIEGVLTKVSTYYVYTQPPMDGGDDARGIPIFVATQWEPYEISLVTMPADNSVGIGRSSEESETNVNVNISISAASTEEKDCTEGETEGQDTATESTPTTAPPVEGSGQACEPDAHRATDLVPSDVVVSGSSTSSPDVQQAAPIEDGRAHEVSSSPQSFQRSNPMATEQELLKAERERVATIESLSAQYSDRVPNIKDLQRSAVIDGHTVEQFRSNILGGMSQEARVADSKIGLSDKEKAEYRLVDIVDAFAEKRDVPSFAREIHQELEKKFERKATRGGVLIPIYDLNAPRTRDAWNTISTGQTAGYNAVPTTFSGEFIDLLREGMTAVKVGAQFISGIPGTGKIAIPKLSTGATGGWVAEGGAASVTSGSVGQILIEPHTYTAYTDVTRRMLQLGVQGFEGMVRYDLASEMGRGLDVAFFEGAASNDPQGLYGLSGANTFTSGSVLTNLATAVGVVGGKKADLNGAVWVTTHAMQMSYMVKEAFSSTGITFMDRISKEMLGFPVIPSTNVSSNRLYFGNFRKYAMIATWGVPEILLDPYTNSTSGTLRLVAFQDSDVAFRHPAAFQTCANAHQ